MRKCISCLLRKGFWLLAFWLIGGFTELQAQETFLKVPLELKVENIYTHKGVEGAKVAIYRKEVTYGGDKIRTRVRTLYSDSSGRIRIDLAPDFTYLFATEKEDFYRNHTPITLPKYPQKGVTTRLSVSLRPKNYQEVRFFFAMQGMQKLPRGLEVKVVQREGDEQFWWPISSRGTADFHLPIEAMYDVKVAGDGVAPFHDSLRLWAPTESGVVIQKSYELKQPQLLWNIGDTLPVSPVQFKGRSTDLLDDSFVKLKRLREILEGFPQLEVVVEVYTDARGDKQGNQLLSERRIAVLKELMSGWSINIEQVRFEAMGDIHLLNDCIKTADCTEDKHQINNRMLVWVSTVLGT